jgi:hypothetical protein
MTGVVGVLSTYVLEMITNDDSSEEEDEDDEYDEDEKHYSCQDRPGQPLTFIST